MLLRRCALIWPRRSTRAHLQALYNRLVADTWLGTALMIRPRSAHLCIHCTGKKRIYEFRAQYVGKQARRWLSERLTMCDTGMTSIQLADISHGFSLGEALAKTEDNVLSAGVRVFRYSI